MSMLLRAAGEAPLGFRVIVMENMFGDILSDMTAGLIAAWHGALGRHRRSPCGVPAVPRTRPTSWAGQGQPYGHDPSAAMMLGLGWPTSMASRPRRGRRRIERAVDKVYAVASSRWNRGSNGTAISPGRASAL